jgi:hypothetical protein
MKDTIIVVEDDCIIALDVKGILEELVLLSLLISLVLRNMQIELYKPRLVLID